MTGLPLQQLDQRIATAEAAFRGLGRVQLVDPGTILGSPRTVMIAVDHPGWGLPTSALLQFVERWLLSGGIWHLTRYAYDLRMQPGPGRFGFHWHDGLYHTHCVDPGELDRDHHFQGAPIDLFAAYQQFGCLLASGSPVTCQGLKPLRS